MSPSTIILWVMVILLWILNLGGLFVLNQLRLTAIESLNKAEVMLDKLANEVVSYDIQVNRAIPVKADIPFKQKLDIPINTVIPIDREIQVPFNTPAGDVIIDVPLKTDFPIDMVVPVDFKQTVNVDTVVQLDTTVPVEIAVAKTPLMRYLEEVKLDLVRIRNRLSLQNQTEVVKASTLPNSEADTPLIAEQTPTETPVVLAETKTISKPMEVTVQEEIPTEEPPVNNQASAGGCDHPYWPLQVGTTWTYNSPATSFNQRIDGIADNQIIFNTQYEGQEIRFSLRCSEEGLGGDFLGDMRRMTELGDLKFESTQGIFLPGAETLEKINTSWVQEFNVTGTVKGSQGRNFLKGQITQGQARAVYTLVNSEVIDTPFGMRKVVQIEQNLDLNFNIEFDIDGLIINGTERVNLSNSYWFAQGLGLLKSHWQGGTIQQTLQVEQSATSMNTSIPGLVEDQLVFVCLLEQQVFKCQRSEGVSEANLTVPTSELEVLGVILPEKAQLNNVIENRDDTISNPTVDNKPDESSINDEPNGPAATPQNPQNDERAALLQYAAAIDNLNERVADAAEDFGEAAIKFRDDLISLDEFKSKYADFAPKIRQLVRDLNGLTPPPLARNIHAKFTGGMAKCEQASNMLSQWFNSFDPSLKQAGTFLVADCVNQVTEASNELNQLVAANSSP